MLFLAVLNFTLNLICNQSFQIIITNFNYLMILSAFYPCYIKIIKEDDNKL